MNRDSPDNKESKDWTTVAQLPTKTAARPGPALDPASVAHIRKTPLYEAQRILDHDATRRSEVWFELSSQRQHPLSSGQEPGREPDSFWTLLGKENLTGI